jgi:peptidoglycan/LPS O-acetylase OafA/YrhL
MVILAHLPDAPRDAPRVLVWTADWFRQYGGLGVELFFVLSGFLVSGLLFREYLTSGRTNVGRFLIRRGFKIYPAFYVFVISTVALRLRVGDTLTSRDIASELLFVQNYGAHVWSHTWSLAVEEHFYLLLAALVFALCRWTPEMPFRRIPAIFCLTTIGVLIARAITNASGPYTPATHHFPTHLQIDALFTGVVLSYYFHTRAGMASWIRRRTAALTVTAAGCLCLAQSLPAPTARFLAGHLLTNAGFGLLVVLAVALPSPRDWVSGVAARIGAQSYSIYLWHAAVMGFGSVFVPRLLGRPTTFYETLVWYVAGSYIVGLVAAKCVEFPALRLRDRLFPDTQRRPAFVSDVAVGPGAPESVGAGGSLIVDCAGSSRSGGAIPTVRRDVTRRADAVRVAGETGSTAGPTLRR